MLRTSLLVFFSSCALAAACNGADAKDPNLPLNDLDASKRPGGDGGPAAEGGTSTSDAASAADGSPTSPVRCTQAELDAADFTIRGNVSVSFSESDLPKQYTLHCVKIKVGMPVHFEGNFVAHPLEAAGGDTPSPIPALTQVNTGGPRPSLGYLDVTFTRPGTFGYRCKTHPTAMFGAVQVVP